MSRLKDAWDDFFDGCAGCINILAILIAIVVIPWKCLGDKKEKQTTSKHTFIHTSSKKSGTWSTNKNNDINQELATGEVWICVSASSYAYHAKQNCRGIKACGSRKEKVKLEEAQQMGRRPCQICH